ncbi:MAG: hypothetical protein OS130_11665 [Thermodesulfobacteriota bacterium]|jgi:hypothetical protein|nr:MAG: hypothetical protein OS130_11665 [Thermodesulfobacteriota bacterium]
MTQPIIKIFKKIKNIVWAFFKRRTWDHLVIHRRKLTENPPSLALPLLCGHAKGKLRCPPEITILLLHNYAHPPIMELSLQYVGITYYHVLKLNAGEPWRQTKKISMLLNYLKNADCKADYILYCDSNDSVLRDNPEKAIRYLEEENCDLLFSRTKSKDNYKYMPEQKIWTDQIAKDNGFYSQWYINAGVFFGRTAFLREVLQAALFYVTDNDLIGEKYKKLRQSGKLLEQLPEFPKGCGSDQTILRYLHPQFYPRMKIDYRGRLALR